MQVTAVSDLHGKLSGLNPAGSPLFIVAGDLAPMNGWDFGNIRSQANWIKYKFFHFCDRFPETEFAVVPGNHDLCLDPKYGMIDSLKFPKNVRLLIDSSTEICGLKLYGTPWVPVISYSWAFEAEHDELQDRFSRIPEGLDILITHAPPRIRDSRIDMSEGRDDMFGSSELTNALFVKKPRFLVCGHIHTGSHDPVQFEGCTCRNVSRVDESYEIAFDQTVFEA